MKGLQVDYFDERTDNNVNGGILVVTSCSLRSVGANAVRSKRSKRVKGEKRAEETAVVAETIVNGVSVTCDVYASLKAAKDDTMSPIHKGIRFDNIPTNEGSGYISQALEHLKTVTFEGETAKIVSL